MTNYNQAKEVCITMLSGNTDNISPDLIKATAERINVLFSLSPEELIRLREELEVQYAVFSDQYRILDDKKPEPWVNNAKAEIPWNFWNRYRMLLEKKNYAPDTINKLDNLTDDILDRLVRPGSNGPFDTRGLVVGHVQSGKTSNYIGLICKAADAGYKLIIVLAGIHNSLRSQTQLRIDEGFLGFDTQQARNFAQRTNIIGVGKINPRLAAHSLTTNEITGDFNRRASESSGINIRGNDPIILVIKKNVSVMKNLLGWLVSRGETMSDNRKQIKNLPLLVIDDEADNASINISKSYVSGINACIRSMLKLFEQSAYIGYTATPYANIFIRQHTDEDVKGLDYSINNIPLALGKDIFPKNYIANIPAPSNYIGPERLFGIHSLENAQGEIHPLDLYRIVDDYREFIKDTHKEGDYKKLEKLPPSLHKAIKCFFLSCAARRARGQEKEHNSMLIHVSHFVKWQDRIASLVLDETKSYVRLIEYKDDRFLRELEALWHKEYEPVTREIMDNPSVNDPAIQPISWSDIEQHLYAATAKIDVRAVHGDTKLENLEHKNIRPLDYYDNKDGLSVIAIGGNKLSRGLTLEGLTISYFLRAAKMYDTLMQMGRWFGYRPGYLDLCRLFTSGELVHWYQHVTVATVEMRAEFDRMSDLNRTPADYGLKVRTHPGALVITAANKFRYKKIMKLSFSGNLEETYSFLKNDPKHLDNYNSTLRLINTLGIPDGPANTESLLRNHFVWRGKNNTDQIISYLSAYHSVQPTFNVTLVTDYILTQQKIGALKNWTIALINNTEDTPGIKINEYILAGRTRRRNADKEESLFYTISKSHIIDPRHEYIDLTDDEIIIAFSQTKEDARKNGKEESKVKYPSPVRIKYNRPDANGLLLIYILNPKPDPEKPAISDVPPIGLAISFPDIENDEKIEYAVNEQFLKDLNYPEELDEKDQYKDIEEEIKETNAEAVENILRKMDSSNKINTSLFLTIEEGYKVIYSKQVKPGDASLTAIPGPVKNGVPLIRSEDIGRYYTNPAPDFQVINTTVANGTEAIITPAIFKKQAFSLITGPFLADENCITIQSRAVPAEYLLALLNSSLFAFHATGMKGEKTRDIVLDFPLKTEAADNNGIITLVKYILLLQQDQSSRDSRIMAAYFLNVLDAAVLEIYFPEEFKNRRLSVLYHLEEIPPFKGEDQEVTNCYMLLNTPKSPVKKTVFTINTIPEFAHIYETLSNED